MYLYFGFLRTRRVNSQSWALVGISRERERERERGGGAFRYDVIDKHYDRLHNMKVDYNIILLILVTS